MKQLNGEKRWVSDERMNRKNTVLLLTSAHSCQSVLESLTITAEQTHLCVFTFPPPKPVLASPLHLKSSVFYFEKEKNWYTNPSCGTYAQPVTVFILTVLVLPRSTACKNHLPEVTSLRKDLRQAPTSQSIVFPGQWAAGRPKIR